MAIVNDMKAALYNFAKQVQGQIESLVIKGDIQEWRDSKDSNVQAISRDVRHICLACAYFQILQLSADEFHDIMSSTKPHEKLASQRVVRNTQRYMKELEAV